MMTKLTLVLTALAACIAGPAAAANCAPRDVVIARLADRFGEVRQSMGLGGNSAVMELFASTETGTWTITVTTPAGLTCLVASGEAYEALAEGRPAPGNDA